MSSLAGLFMASLLAVKSDVTFENSNIVTYNEQSLVDSNRLRADITLRDEKDDGLTAKLILDNQTSYRDKPGFLANNSKIYRAYLEYRGEGIFWFLVVSGFPLAVAVSGIPSMSLIPSIH